MANSSTPAGHVPSKRPWFCMDTLCTFCGTDEFSPVWSPQTLVMCSACSTGACHVGCYEASTGITMSEEVMASGSYWFCSEECRKTHEQLDKATGQRLPLKGAGSQGYSLELVKYDANSRDARTAAMGALKLLKGSFDPLIMDNGRDLLEMVCTGYETPDAEVTEDDEAFNYSAFRIAILRKGSTMVTVATVRVFGTSLAEVPFVATRVDYRRDGNCRRLMQALEDLLRTMGVEWLVLPSIKSVLPMWRHKFRFLPLTLEELHHLQDHIVSPDYDSAQLVKKQLCHPDGTPVHHVPVAMGGRSAAAAGGGGRGRALSSQRAAAAAGQRKRRSQAVSAGEVSSSDGSDGDMRRDRRSAGRSTRPRTRGRGSNRSASRSRGGTASRSKGGSSSSSGDGGESSGSESDAQEYCPSGDKSETPSVDDDDEPLQPSPGRKLPGPASTSAPAAAAAIRATAAPHIPTSHLTISQTAPAATAAGSAAAAEGAGAGAAQLSAEDVAAVAAAHVAARKRLCKFLHNLGSSMPANWQVQIYRRMERGKMTNRSRFVAPDGRIFSSTIAVARALGLEVPEPGAAPAFATTAAPTFVAPGQHTTHTAAAAAAGGGGGAPRAQHPAGRYSRPAAAGAAAAPSVQRTPEQRAQQRKVARAWRQARRDLMLGYCMADAVQSFYQAAAVELQQQQPKQAMVDRLEQDKLQLMKTIAALNLQLSQLHHQEHHQHTPQQHAAPAAPCSAAAPPAVPVLPLNHMPTPGPNQQQQQQQQQPSACEPDLASHSSTAPDDGAAAAGTGLAHLAAGSGLAAGAADARPPVAATTLAGAGDSSGSSTPIADMADAAAVSKPTAKADVNGPLQPTGHPHQHQPAGPPAAPASAPAPPPASGFDLYDDFTELCGMDDWLPPIEEQPLRSTLTTPSPKRLPSSERGSPCATARPSKHAPNAQAGAAGWSPRKQTHTSPAAAAAAGCNLLASATSTAAATGATWQLPPPPELCPAPLPPPVGPPRAATASNASATIGGSVRFSGLLSGANRAAAAAVAGPTPWTTAAALAASGSIFSAADSTSGPGAAVSTPPACSPAAAATAAADSAVPSGHLLDQPLLPSPSADTPAGGPCGPTSLASLTSLTATQLALQVAAVAQAMDAAHSPTQILPAAAPAVSAAAPAVGEVLPQRSCISDSFLGGLLPDVVGVLMPTPISGTTIGAAGASPAAAAAASAGGGRSPGAPAAGGCFPVAGGGGSPRGAVMRGRVDSGTIPFAFTAPAPAAAPVSHTRPTAVAGSSQAASTAAAAAPVAAGSPNLGCALALPSSPAVAAIQVAAAVASPEAAPAVPCFGAAAEGCNTATPSPGATSSTPTPSPDAARNNAPDPAGDEGLAGVTMQAPSVLDACFGEVLQLYANHMLASSQPAGGDAAGDPSDSGDTSDQQHSPLDAAAIAAAVSPTEELLRRIQEQQAAQQLKGGAGGGSGSSSGSASPDASSAAVGGQLDQLYQQLASDMRQAGFLPDTAAAAAAAAAARGAQQSAASRRGRLSRTTAAMASAHSHLSGGDAASATAVGSAAGNHLVSGGGMEAPAAGGWRGRGARQPLSAGVLAGTIPGTTASPSMTAAGNTPTHVPATAAATGGRAAPVVPEAAATASGTPATAAAAAAAVATGNTGRSTWDVDRGQPSNTEPVSAGGQVLPPGSPTPTTGMEWMDLDRAQALQQVAVFAWPDLQDC